MTLLLPHDSILNGYFSLPQLNKSTPLLLGKLRVLLKTFNHFPKQMQKKDLSFPLHPYTADFFGMLQGLSPPAHGHLSVAPMILDDKCPACIVFTRDTKTHEEQFLTHAELQVKNVPLS